MRRYRYATLSFAVLALGLTVSPALGQDASRTIEGGGVHVAGWTGRIDAREAGRGLSLESAKLEDEDGALHVTTGPSVAYWNPAHTASGDYTVTATFHEPQYMNRNNHPHPYGIIIAGNDMGTDRQSYLYCAAYGSGSFIVRGFGPSSFQMNGRRGQRHEAVNKATAAGEPVTQEIALSVRGDEVSCSINGTVVATYSKSELVTEGKLTSTDGVYGIRFGHNTEATVSGLTVVR